MTDKPEIRNVPAHFQWHLGGKYPKPINNQQTTRTSFPKTNTWRLQACAKFWTPVECLVLELHCIAHSPPPACIRKTNLIQSHFKEKLSKQVFSMIDKTIPFMAVLVLKAMKKIPWGNLYRAAQFQELWAFDVQSFQFGCLNLWMLREDHFPGSLFPMCFEHASNFKDDRLRSTLWLSVSFAFAVELPYSKGESGTECIRYRFHLLLLFKHLRGFGRSGKIERQVVSETGWANIMNRAKVHPEAAGRRQSIEKWINHWQIVFLTLAFSPSREAAAADIADLITFERCSIRCDGW